MQGEREKRSNFQKKPTADLIYVSICLPTYLPHLPNLPTPNATILRFRSPAQRIDRLLKLEPTLILRPPMKPIRLFPLQPLHSAKDDASALDADDSHAEIVGHDLVARFARVFFNGLDAFDREADGADAVHGGRGAALLDVAGDGEAGFEATL